MSAPAAAPLHGPTDTGREGHVSRARLLGEGSVFARRLEEQRQAQQQLGDAAAAEQQQEQQPAQVTWPELWNARTTAGFVGLQLGQEESSTKAMQLWWSPFGGAGGSQQEAGLKRKHSRLLQYSSLISRVLQREGTTAAAARTHSHHPASAPVSLTVAQPCELFGGPLKRQRLEQQAEAAVSGSRPLAAGGAGWVCCNHLLEGGAGGQQGPVPCGACNPAGAVSCCECGAARWDGPDGQLQQRITAALQTADLDVTNIRQVASRVLAESASQPGLGLVPQAGMQPAVHEVVRLRKLAAHTAAAAAGHPLGLAAAGGSSGGRDNLTEQLAAAPAVGQRVGAGGLFGGADEVQLLAQHGCLPAAEGVYCRLMTWLQQQATNPAEQPAQQQQQRGQLGIQDSEGEARLLSAAAAAAALAPHLLTSVLQQQGHLPATKLVPGSVLAFVNTCFQEAAAAAVAAQVHSTATSQQQQGSPTGQHCTPLRRPLPLHTLLGLCDRRGAAVRQALHDLAADSVAACGGRLPVVTRSFRLQGCELLCEEVPPEEWLWARWCSNHRAGRRLPAGEDGRQVDEGDVLVVERFKSNEWDEVVLVRSRMKQLLQAWLSSLEALQTAGSLQQQRQQQPELFEPHAWDRQMCRLLGGQLQRTRQGWGSAPAWALRHSLARTQPAPARGPDPKTQQGGVAAQQQQQLPQQQCQDGSQGQQSGGRALEQERGVQQPSARRRSLRLQAQQGESAGAQAVGQAAGSADVNQAAGSADGDGSSSSSSDASGRDGDDSTGSSWSLPGDPDQSTDSGEEDHQPKPAAAGQGQQQQQQQQRRQLLEPQLGEQHESGDDSDDGLLHLNAWLASLDDLQIPPQAAVPGRGEQVSRSQPWRPAASGVWRAVGNSSGQQAAAAAAGGSGSSQRPAARQGGEPSGAGVWAAELPAGMQGVLAEAAKAGVAPHVLQRTVARLKRLLGSGRVDALTFDAGNMP